MPSIDGQPLSATHLEHLKQSAISPEQIAARGYRTVTNPRALPTAFTAAQGQLTGLLIPVTATHGETVAWQLKPDTPRTVNGKQPKYEHAGRVCLDVPAAARQYLRDADAELWITEGCKKVDAAVSNGILCTIGVQGVWMWRQDRVTLPDWNDIALKGRVCIIAYDSDVMTKSTVRSAVVELAQTLEYRGATVRYCLMPDLPNGAKCGLDDAFASGLTRADLEALVVDTLPGAGTDWPEPIPLDDPAGPEPPADALPESVQAFIDALATSTQTPRGLSAALAIAALSAAAGGRYAVSLSDFDRDHTEALVLHTAAVMAPAERKTAVFNAVAAPLNAVAQERNRDEAIPVAEWKSKLEVLEKRHKAAVDAEATGPKKGKDGVATVDTATLENNRKAAVQALHDHWEAVVYPTTLLADDITNQRLKELMVQNRGAIAVVSDEGTFLEVLGGRHSDGVPQLETILNGHTGGKVDMQRRAGSPLFWPRGYLTIGLAIQHHVIETWGSTDGVMGKGAAARLMAVFPPSRVGERDTNAPRVPDTLTVGWDALIRRLLDYKPNQSPDTAGYPLPCELRLSTDAWRIYKPHWEWIESQLKSGAAYGDFRDWAGKLHGATLRLAGLIHLASEVQPDVFKISGHTMQCAIALSHWFAAHARIMYRVMAGRSGQSAARQVLDVIRELGIPTTKREIHRKLQDRVAFQKADDLTAPLALLEEYGWIRTERDGKSLTVHLNPYSDPDNTDSATTNHQNHPSLSVLSAFPEKRKINPPPDIAPPAPLQPTGTDGARPGEIKL